MVRESTSGPAGCPAEPDGRRGRLAGRSDRPSGRAGTVAGRPIESARLTEAAGERRGATLANAKVAMSAEDAEKAKERAKQAEELAAIVKGLVDDDEEEEGDDGEGSESEDEKQGDK